MNDCSNNNSSNITWVSANAGTGKTKILIDRVLSLLLNGTSHSQILCITFTKAAAYEMYQRITSELSSWVILEQDHLCSKLSMLLNSTPTKEQIDLSRQLFFKLLDCSPGLQIQTIHAFCQNILKQFPLEAGIFPGFNIIDSNLSSELIHKAKMHLLSKSDSKEIEKLCYSLGEYNIHDLVHEIIANRLSFIEDFDVNYFKQIFNIKNTSFDDLISDFIEVIDLTEAEIHPLFHSSYDTDRNFAIKILKFISLKKEEQYIYYKEYIDCFVTTKLEPRQKIITNSLGKKFPKLYDKLYTEQVRVIEFLENINNIKSFQMTKSLYIFAHELICEYNDLKQSKAVLDYNDLLEITAKLLNNYAVRDWVLYKIENKIRHILVDEAQDTNEIQWVIIENLLGEYFSGEYFSGNDKNASIFVVGDEKQSIYSFQGADPKIFDKVRNRFSKMTSNLGQKIHFIKLTKSYRYNDAISILANKICNKENIKNKISVANKYSSLDEHISTRSQIFGKVELWPLIKVEHNSCYLANLIADRIRYWLDNKVILKSKNREIRADDIMILVRKRSAIFHDLIQALNKRKIPISGVDRINLSKSLVIDDILSVAKFVLNPLDDLNLACLLKSPFINMSEEELMTLCLERGNQNNEKKNNEKLWHVIKDGHIKNFLLDIINYSYGKTIYEFYLYLLEIRNGRKNLYSRLGIDIEDEINEFFEVIKKFELTNTPILQNFVEYFVKTNVEIKRDQDVSNGNVRIMTIHAAKGLQSPIVILADDNQIPHISGKIIFIDNKVPLWRMSSLEKSSIMKFVCAAEKEAMISEYLRLLYVAITRAQDELIICAYNNKENVQEHSWYNHIHEILNQNNTHVEESIDGDILSIRTGIKFEQVDFINSEEIEFKNRPLSKLSTAKAFAGDQDQRIELYTKLHEDSKVEFTKKSNMIDKEVFSPLHVKDKNLLYGIMIHKILEILFSKFRFSTIDEYMIENIAGKFNVEKHIVSAIVKNFIELKKLVNESAQILTEVNIAGFKDESIYIARADNIIIHDNLIIIIDYKTSKIYNISDFPKQYSQQLFLYKSLIQDIYPDKEIKCAIFWTESNILSLC